MDDEPMLTALCAICREFVADPTDTPGFSTTRGPILQRNGKWVHLACDEASDDQHGADK